MIKLTNQFWAMERSKLGEVIDKFQALDGNDFDVAAAAQDVIGKPYQMYGSVAVINVIGPLAKYNDIFMQIFGGTSTLDIKNAVIAADSDPEVSATLIYVDSPGGEFHGTDDAAIAIATAEKPVIAVIADAGCSGAYYLISGADAIYANQSAFVGSIGVYCVLYDTSQLYAGQGVKVNVIKAGDYKGVGEDGTPLTDPQIADAQRNIDEIYQLFVEAVATGRGMSESDALDVATGQVWMAGTALELGLIDGIATVEEILGQMIEGNMSNIKPSNIIAKMAEAQKDLKAESKVETTIETPAVEVKAETSAVEPKIETPTQPVIEVKAESPKVETPKVEINIEEKIKAAVTSAIETDRKRLSEILAVCKNAVFAMEQFVKGSTVGEAAIAWTGELEKMLATQGNGAQPVSTAPAEKRLSGEKVTDLFSTKHLNN